MTADYTKLDEAIVAAVDAGQRVPLTIQNWMSLHTKYFAQTDFLSKRLQALKRAGRITYQRTTGWQVSAEEK